ncbi:putative bifunctional diguanylate cyclase/phosphodiesterase [Aurantiacibacter aquimixticola]|uniref:EAL domain-containing protein n=1 Tax=Aurantiacibacter aquimixticola TaxID=1958945 RepID=A0A419RSX7_9SPHN|nr:EAL domain-containing protein [Aurantiacibacter aquimixticola]RJY08901.1 EAL domain-containing protein [Aurantiacibacter aquimixticola]
MQWPRNLFGLPAKRDGELARAQVRAHLDAAVHTKPWSALVGSVCAGAGAWTCALATGESPLVILAAIVSVVAVLRVAHAVGHDLSPENPSVRLLDAAFPLTACLFALSLGLIGSLTIMRDAAAGVQLLGVGSAIAFGLALSVRSAGRPAIAIAQLSCAYSPIIYASLQSGSYPLLVLAVVLPNIAIGMGTMTLTIFAQLEERIETALASRAHAETIRAQTRLDPVTGLLNRHGFDEEFARLANGLGADERLALMWIDLDRFKDVNETLGHEAGDETLRIIASRLRTKLPEEAVLARFASDEFVFAARVALRAEAEILASDMGEEAARPFRIDGHRLSGGASLGAALMPDDASSTDKLMQAADLALYHAKASRRNEIRFFDRAMTRELARRKEVESELRSALQKDELKVFFQPIVDLQTGHIRTFEALVRWFHPEKGELLPDEFIPVAEDTGLIITLGNWVTAQAAKAASSWPEHVTLAVNLSPVQIKAPGAALGILSALAEAQLDPARLELEVTESLFLEDDEHTATFMNELAQRGVRFALDDFGTGYSSMRYIHDYPFRTIKVDRSFVSGANIGARSDAIVRAVAEMGTTLGLDVVAEGIETIGQLRTIRSSGCTLGQGFYFSRAVPDYQAALLLAEEDRPLASNAG